MPSPILPAFALAILFLHAIVAVGTTILVDAEGEGDYLSIKEGVQGASHGDTVLVAPGRTRERATGASTSKMRTR